MGAVNMSLVRAMVLLKVAKNDVFMRVYEVCASVNAMCVQSGFIVKSYQSTGPYETKIGKCTNHKNPLFSRLFEIFLVR